MEELKKEGLPRLGDLYDLKEDISIDDLSAEFYVEKLMNKVSPKFSVLQKPIEKTLVALLPESLEEKVGTNWKGKFKTVYNHIVMDVDEFSEEEERQILVEQNKKYYD